MLELPKSIASVPWPNQLVNATDTETFTEHLAKMPISRQINSIEKQFEMSADRLPPPGAALTAPGLPIFQDGLISNAEQEKSKELC